jgi:hypothetical protein
VRCCAHGRPVLWTRAGDPLADIEIFEHTDRIALVIRDGAIYRDARQSVRT